MPQIIIHQESSNTFNTPSTGFKHEMKENKDGVTVCNLAYFRCPILIWDLLFCLFVLFEFNVAFNVICHITTVSGCDRELNVHFYSAASLWYQIPDTFT